MFSYNKKNVASISFNFIDPTFILAVTTGEEM